MKKIFVLWQSMSAAHNLDKIVSEFANKGEKDFLIVAPQKTKTYPDVCVPLAALMEWYKEEGITFTPHQRLLLCKTYLHQCTSSSRRIYEFTRY